MSDDSSRLAAAVVATAAAIALVAPGSGCRHSGGHDFEVALEKEGEALRLAAVPEIALDSDAFRPSPAEAAEIRSLIESLSVIERPDIGMSPTMLGHQFAPIPSSKHFGGGLIMIDHRLETAAAVERLVALGPKALPFLLAALGDATPTELVIESAMSGMWYDRELTINPLHPREADVVRDRGWSSPIEFPRVVHVSRHRDSSLLRDDVSRHTVTRGDVCFVVLGQIVNRNYSAVRYQPSGLQVINSPTHDRELAAAVRRMWASEDPARTLLDSLLADLSTRGDWGKFQCGAARRLLFYFPGETADLIARRIDGLDVRRAQGDARREQYEANEVPAVELLEAVNASDHPAIARALAGVIRRTDDPELFDAALGDAVVARESELVWERLRERVAATPDAGQSTAFSALVLAARFFPGPSEELFRLHAAHGTASSRRTTIRALGRAGIQDPWAVELLASFLGDTKSTSSSYGPDYDRHPLRICDEAAEVLAALVPAITFRTEGAPADLDRQITKIRRFLDGDRDVVFERPEPFPADVSERDPVSVLSFEEDFGRLFRFSDARIIFAGRGFLAGRRWDYEIVEIDVAGRKIARRTPLDTWAGGVTVLGPTEGKRAFCWHVPESGGGHVLVRGLPGGRVLERFEIPSEWIEGERAFGIRRGFDVALSGDERWVVALTADGDLHSVDTRTGAHAVEWRAGEGRRPGRSLVALRRCNRFLVSGHGSGEDRVPLRIWDQDARTMTEVERVPHRGWRDGWGDFAWEEIIPGPEVWNLRTRKRLEVPGGTEGSVDFELSRDGRTLFAAQRDGSVRVFRADTGRPLGVLRGPEVPAGDPRYESPFDITLSSDDRVLFWRHDDLEHERTTIAVFAVEDFGRE